jgi:cholesterol transport system auxiliary component
MSQRRLPSSTRLISAALLACALLASGCSLKKSYPAKQSFLIEARRAGEARAATAAAASSTAVLRVRDLQIAAPFEGRGFVQRDSALGYRADFYHEFLVAPSALLTEQTRQWLAASGLFRHVLGPAGKADPTHSLEGNVTALYGDFREPASPKAVLAVEFFLIAESSSPAEIVIRQNYRQEIALDNRLPDTLANGWSQALGQVLTALEHDLARTLAR